MAGARICRWFNGKSAALSLRFDDAHPTQVEKAEPMLNEHGLIGTFLIDPGRAEYARHKAAWEGTVIQHGHELGNHTLHHRGARTDREADAEIGGCAQLIRALRPSSTLLAFHPGGRTVWLQRRPLESFLAKHRLFLSGASMSCTEASPWFSYDRFRERLEHAIAAGDWMQCHFHGIDAGRLFISTPLFRRLLKLVRTHRAEVWQAGMAAIHKYQRERDHAVLVGHPGGDDTLSLHLACATDPSLYDHPLTVEVVLPSEARAPTVVDVAGNHLEGYTAEVDGQCVVRFDVEPVDAVYTVRAARLGEAYLREHRPDSVGADPDWDLHHDSTNPFAVYACGGPLVVDPSRPYELGRCRTGDAQPLTGTTRQSRDVVADLFETPWYVRLVGDASLAYGPSDASSCVREVMSKRRTSPGDPPDYFILFEDVDGAAFSRTDWRLHFTGELTIGPNCFTVVQGDAAADVAIIAPEVFRYEVRRKRSQAGGTAELFSTPSGVSSLLLRAAERVAGGYFLAVVTVHPAASASGSAVAAVREPNVLGVRIALGAREDLALFALDQPEIVAAGVTAVGRSCFIRRSGGQITAAVLHNGQCVSVHGGLLFETDSCGHAAVTISDDAVAAQLDIYDGRMIRLHAAERPVRVLVNGQEQAFEYEAARRCIRLESAGARTVQVVR